MLIFGIQDVGGNHKCICRCTCLNHAERVDQREPGLRYVDCDAVLPGRHSELNKLSDWIPLHFNLPSGHWVSHRNGSDGFHRHYHGHHYLSGYVSFGLSSALGLFTRSRYARMANMEPSK